MDLFLGQKTEPLEYYSEEEWDAFMKESKRHETPFVMVKLSIIRRKYHELLEKFPYAKVFYAVKANPATQVIDMLMKEGACFDIASRYELDRVLACGASPDKLSYGNTIKKIADIKYFYEKGVRLFATDSECDIHHLAEHAPGSKVFVRILVEGCRTADWPLSRKFGCNSDLGERLLVLARDLGLDPVGVSFHVGSQQKDVGSWVAALDKVRYMFDRLEEKEDIKCWLINMGGGLPAQYMARTNPIDVYADEIGTFIKDNFSDREYTWIMEPGRSLAGDSGVLVSEVVLLAKKGVTSLDEWLFTDAGKFNGLIETLDECIKYAIWTEASGPLSDRFIIAGPTCDSADIMYEEWRNPLPSDIKVGDRMYWLSTGAYTSSYCSVEFNGFPPLATYIIE